MLVRLTNQKVGGNFVAEHVIAHPMDTRLLCFFRKLSVVCFATKKSKFFPIEIERENSAAAVVRRRQTMLGGEKDSSIVSHLRSKTFC